MPEADRTETARRDDPQGSMTTDPKLAGDWVPDREPGDRDPNPENALNGSANNSQREDYRHNPANLAEAREAAGEPEGEDSPQHGQIPFIEDDLDIAHGELKQHNEEFMETYGHTVMPNVDPPMPITREESTAPPQ